MVTDALADLGIDRDAAHDARSGRRRPALKTRTSPKVERSPERLMSSAIAGLPSSVTLRTLAMPALA